MLVVCIRMPFYRGLYSRVKFILVLFFDVRSRPSFVLDRPVEYCSNTGDTDIRYIKSNNIISSYTVRRSVIVLTMAPVPATSTT